MKIRELIVFGTESTSLEIYEVADFFYQDIFDNICMLFFSEDMFEEEVLRNKVNNKAFEIKYIMGFTNYNLRKKCLEMMKAFSNFEPFTVVNSTAYIARSAIVGNGCYIAANVSISSQAVIEDHCIINLNASVGHGALIKEHVTVLPGARVGGKVVVGKRSLIGSNAFIGQNVNVGNDNVIDALTYIHDDLPEKRISSSRKTKTFKRVM